MGGSGPEPRLVSMGQRLRSARLAQGHTLDDAAAVLCIRPAFLDALEEGEHGRLPGVPYASGFMRSYALYLGLDGDRMADELIMKGHSGTSATPLLFRQPNDERPLRISRLASGLAALVLAMAWIALHASSGAALTDARQTLASSQRLAGIWLFPERPAARALSSDLEDLVLFAPDPA